MRAPAGAACDLESHKHTARSPHLLDTGPDSGAVPSAARCGPEQTSVQQPGGNVEATKSERQPLPRAFLLERQTLMRRPPPQPPTLPLSPSRGPLPWSHERTACFLDTDPRRRHFPFRPAIPVDKAAHIPPLYSWHGRWPRWASQPQCRDILGWMPLTSEGSPCSVGCLMASLTPTHGQPRLSADIVGHPLEPELSWLSPPVQRMKGAASGREGTREPSQAPRMLLPGLERRSWGPVYPCRGRGTREVRASSPASPPPPPTVEVKVKAYPVLWNTSPGILTSLALAWTLTFSPPPTPSHQWECDP